ncbi:MAG TPA: alcohol dehydrogenase catalytic domain-containing protein [Nocardioidaceae bacterium]|jgi:threonine dehydrogenase-like Zn-dependent dehydrogenase
MKALVFHDPWNLTVEERPDPTPGDGQVLLRVLKTGICGSDLHGFTGENGRRHPGQVMGHETVATVVWDPSQQHPPGSLVTVNPVFGCTRCAACAAGEPQRCAKRRVLGVDPALSSAFAELMTVPAESVVGLPDDVPVDVGALIEPLSVGFHAARRGAVSATDTVLVIGGGPIGQAAALAAERLGGRQIAVSEPDAARRALCELLGFPALAPRGAAEDVAADVRAVLGDLPSVVIDAVGTSATLSTACAVSSMGARIVLVGMGTPAVELSAYAVSTEERSVLGSFCYSSRDFADTAAWAVAEARRLGALVDARVSLEEAPAAFADLAAGRLRASKVMVTVTEPDDRRGGRAA